MEQLFNSLVSSRNFDPFTMEFEEPTETPVVAPAPAPAMPKLAPRVTATRPVRRAFGIEDVKRIRLSEAKKELDQHETTPTEEQIDAAWLVGSERALDVVLRDQRENTAKGDLLAEIRSGLTELLGEVDGRARYREMKRAIKAKLEAEKAKPAFEPAVIVEAAPSMVPTHLLCRELMAAAPADVEEVAKRIVGTLKGDNRYATCESARKQLLVDAKARVIAMLVASGVSPEEALRRGEVVKNARPLPAKMAAPTKTAATEPARPLTADELKTLFGKVGTAEEPTAKPAPNRGKARTPAQIALYHDLLKLKRLEEAAEKREREEVMAEARRVKAAKQLAEEKAAEKRAADKAKAAADAAAKAAAKRDKGKRTR